MPRLHTQQLFRRIRAETGLRQRISHGGQPEHAQHHIALRVQHRLSGAGHLAGAVFRAVGFDERNVRPFQHPSQESILRGGQLPGSRQGGSDYGEFSCVPKAFRLRFVAGK